MIKRRYDASRRWSKFLAVGLMAVFLAPAVWAQSVAEKAEGSVDSDGTVTWQWIIQSGGWVMYPLAAMSVVALALFIYFLVVLRRSQIVPAMLHREVVEKIKAGALDDARRACSYRPSPLASVVMVALEYVRTVPKPDPVLLKDVIEGEGGRQAESILGQVQFLLDVAVIAPMLGLLGTVVGMLNAFSRIAGRLDMAKPIFLAEGVAQALITTVFGLVIGIPAMMFYAYFRRRASRMVSHLESASTDTLTALLSRKQPE
jgi:biopolymer transport protein ExbB